MSKKSVMFTKYFFRVLMISIVFILIGYIFKSFRDPKVWKTDDTDPEDERVHRLQTRGLIGSLVSSIFTSILAVVMVNFGVSQNAIELLFGYLFAPVFGFVVDTCFGMDTGFRLLKSNPLNALKYGMNQLASGSFIRFVVSFLLDMYISKPMSAVFKAFSVFNLEKVAWNGFFAFLDKFVLQNVTSIVQSIVAVITFQTYTNQSRFLWAYPDKTLPKTSRVQSFTIMVASSLAGIFYLSQYSKEPTSLSLHMFLTILSFLLLSGLYLSGAMDEEYIPPEEMERRKKEKGDEPPYTTKRVLIGTVLMSIFFFVGIIYPFFQRKSALEKSRDAPSDLVFENATQLGKYMRDNITDPITQKVIHLMDLEAKMSSGAPVIPATIQN